MNIITVITNKDMVEAAIFTYGLGAVCLSANDDGSYSYSTNGGKLVNVNCNSREHAAKGIEALKKACGK